MKRRGAWQVLKRGGERVPRNNLLRSNAKAQAVKLAQNTSTMPKPSTHHSSEDESKLGILACRWQSSRKVVAYAQVGGRGPFGFGPGLGSSNL
eukprot:2584207-Amphidinium_carterae.1